MTLSIGEATGLLTHLCAAAICLSCTAIAAQISRATRCAVRFGVLAMFVGALAELLGGIWNFGDWVELVFFSGVLIYLLANLRVPAVLPGAAWSNRAALAIAVLVAGVLALTFAQG